MDERSRGEVCSRGGEEENGGGEAVVTTWWRVHACGQRQNRGGGSNGLNRFQIQMVQKCLNFPNFDRSENDLPELQNFEIKYSFEDLEKMNNFLHRRFIRF
jgi:hypothetical protein